MCVCISYVCIIPIASVSLVNYDWHICLIFFSEDINYQTVVLQLYFLSLRSLSIVLLPH